MAKRSVNQKTKTETSISLLQIFSLWYGSGFYCSNNDSNRNVLLQRVLLNIDDTATSQYNYKYLLCSIVHTILLKQFDSYRLQMGKIKKNYIVGPNTHHLKKKYRLSGLLLTGKVQTENTTTFNGLQSNDVRSSSGIMKGNWGGTWYTPLVPDLFRCAFSPEMAGYCWARSNILRFLQNNQNSETNWCQELRRYPWLVQDNQCFLTFMGKKNGNQLNMPSEWVSGLIPRTEKVYRELTVKMSEVKQHISQWKLYLFNRKGKKTAATGKDSWQLD